ncbi:hypothetical protein DRO55_02930 [Candidatus Bathyarchaeota archaeon]|nr:MAG: hypothetical protein DRO55_02930 [Candidatus Bathyarchaeota archaeon]
MTAFEHYFEALKKALGREDIYDIWPDFEPEYDEREYAWTTFRGLGETLLLNCGRCDGPSDLRHPRCEACVKKREEIARKTYQKATGRSIEKWPTIILCRIHTE